MNINGHEVMIKHLVGLYANSQGNYEASLVGGTRIQTNDSSAGEIAKKLFQHDGFKIITHEGRLQAILNMNQVASTQVMTVHMTDGTSHRTTPQIINQINQFAASNRLI